MGLTAMNVFVGQDQRDPRYLESVAELAAKRGVELRGGTGGNFYLGGDDARAEVERVASSLRTMARHLGVRYSSLASGPMLTHHRFADGPSLEERKTAIARNLAD